MLAFIKILMSYECQHEIAKDAFASFSVRKDVLKEQFMSLTKSSRICMPDGDVVIGDKLDNDKDYQTFIRLLDNARGQKTIPNELSLIIYEELDEYYNGMID